MAYDELVAVSTEYSPRQRAELMALAEQYRRRNEREVLELAMISSDMAADDFIILGLEPDSNPQLLEAFQLKYPNVDLASLVGRSPESLDGFVNGVKGKYFEVLVKDRLNTGETVGELQLEPGQEARLAESSTQRGWDLEIVDGNGETVEQIQLKATEDLSYVKSALERYPDIRVAVPEEIDSESADIIGTDISHLVLEETTEDQMAELSEDAISNTVDIAADLALDIIPVTSALLIGVTEGRRYLMGQASLRDSVRSGGKRLGRASAYSAIGSALSATGLGLGAIPVVMGMRTVEARVSGRIALGDQLEARTAELNELLFISEIPSVSHNAHHASES